MPFQDEGDDFKLTHYPPNRLTKALRDARDFLKGAEYRVVG
jgi:hypothetical protein